MGSARCLKSRNMIQDELYRIAKYDQVIPFHVCVYYIWITCNKGTITDRNWSLYMKCKHMI